MRRVCDDRIVESFLSRVVSPEDLVARWEMAGLQPNMWDGCWSHWHHGSWGDQI
jgi:hypothetical protein